jgi:ABC-type transporter Mla MlaB component
MMNRLITATLALSFFAITHGFSPAFHPQKLAFKSACQELKSTMPLSGEYDDEITMMIKARECAFSDVSSAKEARSFLHQILHVQSGCVSGVISGHDLCENQDEVAEIVAHLRQKVSSGAAALR